MAAIKFHRQFVVDLVGSGDSQLPNRVLKKIFTEAGDFRADRDDHAYKGIADAWIRVVSRGNSAYRVIYLRERDDITLYRAGPHSVEDNLAAPAATHGFPMTSSEIVETSLRPIGASASSAEMVKTRVTVEESQASRFMKNHESRRLFEQMTGRRLLPHKEVILVSPYISFDILRSTQSLGQMLDEWIGDGCNVTLITKPPAAEEMSEFDLLASRGFSIWYVPKLHAKAYVFRVDRAKLNRFQQHAKDMLLLGSANLTNSGFNPAGIRAKDPQIELSYQIAVADEDDLDDFLSYLAGVSIGHDVLKNNISSNGAKNDRR